MGRSQQRSYAMEIATALVMASEIFRLERCALHKQENRVVPVRFALAKKRAKQAEFIEGRARSRAWPIQASAGIAGTPPATATAEKDSRAGTPSRAPLAQRRREAEGTIRWTNQWVD